MASTVLRGLRMDGGRGVDLHRHFLQPAGRLGAWGLHEPTQETFRWRSPAACTTMPGSDERASGQVGPPPLSHKTTTLVTCTLTHATAPACHPYASAAEEDWRLAVDFSQTSPPLRAGHGNGMVGLLRSSVDQDARVLFLLSVSRCMMLGNLYSRVMNVIPSRFLGFPGLLGALFILKEIEGVSAVSRRSMTLVQAVHHGRATSTLSTIRTVLNTDVLSQRPYSNVAEMIHQPTFQTSHWYCHVNQSGALIYSVYKKAVSPIVTI